MMSLPLTRGMWSLVDDDYERFGSYKWTASSYEYAYRNAGGKRLYLHREIMKAPPGVLVDHKSGFRLDNRKENLRLATHSQNATNAKARSACGYRGVTFDKRDRVWIARSGFGRNGKTSVTIGYFKDPKEATAAYDAYARKTFPEFARLNFPSECEL